MTEPVALWLSGGKDSALVLLYFRNTLISMTVFLPILFSRVSLRTTAPTARRLATQRG